MLVLDALFDRIRQISSNVEIIGSWFAQFRQLMSRLDHKQISGGFRANLAKQSDMAQRGSMNGFVGCAPLRKRFAFVAGNDGCYFPLPAPRCPRLRSIVISARIDIAISSGVIAPRSRPAGALMRSMAVTSMPSAISFSRSAAILRRLPTKAW